MKHLPDSCIVTASASIGDSAEGVIRLTDSSGEACRREVAALLRASGPARGDVRPIDWRRTLWTRCGNMPATRQALRHGPTPLCSLLRLDVTKRWQCSHQMDSSPGLAIIGQAGRSVMTGSSSDARQILPFCSPQPVNQAIDPYPLRVSHTGKEGSVSTDGPRRHSALKLER